MKLKFYLLILICTLHVFYMQASASDSETIIISLNKNSTENNHDEAPPKGKRSLPTSDYCIIDFNRYSVETSISEPIESYEIWDAEGDTIYASLPDEVTFVQYLSGMEGSYQIRLITVNYNYIGIINL